MSGVAGAWRIADIGGHPAEIYDPPEVKHPHSAVMYLHGVKLGKLTDKPEYLRRFDEAGMRVIAPHTERSWWTDKICPEFDPKLTAERYLLDHVLPWLQAEMNVKPGLTALLGISMGGQGALRLAFKYPRLFPIAAAISPAIDYWRYFEIFSTLPEMYSDPEAARQDSAILHLHPLNWPRHLWFCCDPNDVDWGESSERLQMKLASLGIPHTCDLETEAGGHHWRYYNAMAGPAFHFILERLQQETQRLDAISSEESSL
ncbi:Esterase [Planctomycetales bacterium 10988]|nr:Esterase [Planctomycetales bacterium 10988]